MQKDNSLVVCHNVIKGGGIPIVRQFLAYCIENKHKVVLLCPSLSAYHTIVSEFGENKDFLNIHYFNPRLNHILLKPLINYIYLPIIAAKLNIAKVYNFGNVAFPSNKPQFLLMHNAFAVYKGNDIYNEFTSKSRLRQRLMNFFIRINFRFANVIGVQTEDIKKSLKEISGRDAILVPNYPTNLLIYKSCFRLKSNIDEIRLLFLSKYYAHKNFNILIPLVKIIKKNKERYRITLTIDYNEPGALGFIDKIEKEDLLEYFNIIGNVAEVDLETIYHEHDGLLLPTLMESFSGTYIEAMRFGKPIFTSDRHFAKEVCKDAAFYFDPLNARLIFSTINNAYKNITEIDDKVRKGQDIVQEILSLNLNVNEQIWKSI